MADPVFESISNTTYASRTNTTVTAPSGIANGDTLFYALFTGASSPVTATAPSGFALPSGGTWPIAVVDEGSFDGRYYVWYKIASGESGNYTATHAAASTQGVMWRVSGGDGAQPAATTNFGTTPTAPNDSTATGLTTTNNGALVMVVGWDWADTTNNLTGPSGTTPTFTERLDVTLTGLWTGNLATAGATGNKTFANNSNNTGTWPWAASMLVVEPSAGGSASRQSLLMTGMGR
ncbi:MAG: hypothetical protein OEV17_00015 [Nitrospira sp.]|nr:hypothetical protein [Nitrospira sp.]